MKTAKVWKLIEKLPLPCHREVGRWVASPFFNRKIYLEGLWGYLSDCSKQKSRTPVPMEAFEACFPGKPYNNQKLRLAMSDLYKLLLEYLSYSEIQHDTSEGLLRQAQALRKIGLKKQARRQLMEARRLNENKPQRHAGYFQLQYDILAESYRLSSSDRPEQTDYRVELAEVGDIALLGSKLKQACTLLSHQAVYPSSQQLGFIEGAVSFIEKTGLKTEACIAVYYQGYKMLVEPLEEQHFQEYKRLVFELGNTFPPSEARDLLLMAINYCIRKVNIGQHIYVVEANQLYKEGLRLGYLLENGLLSRFTYHNIVIMGLQTRDYAWVEQFIYDYREKLERHYQEGAFHYCLARLEYTRGDYNKALSLLQRANYKDTLLNLAAKVLLLKVYFEAKEHEVLHAHLDAMTNFVRRNRVIGYHRANYLNMVKYARKLLSVNAYHKPALKKLAEAIEKEQNLTEKQWFLQQLSAM